MVQIFHTLFNNTLTCFPYFVEQNVLVYPTFSYTILAYISKNLFNTTYQYVFNNTYVNILIDVQAMVGRPHQRGPYNVAYYMSQKVLLKDVNKKGILTNQELEELKTVSILYSSL